MTDALLTLLRWCLLVLLYLFFFRVLQATWAGSRATAPRVMSLPRGRTTVRLGNLPGQFHFVEHDQQFLRLAQREHRRADGERGDLDCVFS